MPEIQTKLCNLRSFFGATLLISLNNIIFDSRFLLCRDFEIFDNLAWRSMYLYIVYVKKYDSIKQREHWILNKNVYKHTFVQIAVCAMNKRVRSQKQVPFVDWLGKAIVSVRLCYLLYESNCSFFLLLQLFHASCANEILIHSFKIFDISLVFFIRHNLVFSNDILNFFFLFDFIFPIGIWE